MAKEYICIDDDWRMPEGYLKNGGPVKDNVYSPDASDTYQGHLFFIFEQFSFMHDGEKISPCFIATAFVELPDSMGSDIEEALKRPAPSPFEIGGPVFPATPTREFVPRKRILEPYIKQFGDREDEFSWELRKLLLL